MYFRRIGGVPSLDPVGGGSGFPDDPMWTRPARAEGVSISVIDAFEDLLSWCEADLWRFLPRIKASVSSLIHVRLPCLFSPLLGI